MEPIPQTVEAIDELDPYLVDEQDLRAQLVEQADRVSRIAPGCLGISVTTRESDVTFTLVATDQEVATWDAAQYVGDGPCVDVFEDGQGMAAHPSDLLDESRWQVFAQVSAAAGVRSTLTFPMLSEGEVVATINLYGAAADTFEGKHPELAAVFGAWASGAVRNADLGFMTRRLAEQAPQRLRDQAMVDTGVGILAASLDLDIDAARERLIDAAQRAGVPPAVLARTLVDPDASSGRSTDLGF